MKKYPPSPKKATAQTVASNNIIAYGIFRFHEGMSICRFHELSHTFATIANSLGGQLYDISKAMGHSNTSVTSGVYTHLLDPNHKELIEEMDKAIREKK